MAELVDSANEALECAPEAFDGAKRVGAAVEELIFESPESRSDGDWVVEEMEGEAAVVEEALVWPKGSQLSLVLEGVVVN